MRITKERLEEIVREEVNAYVLQEKLTDKEEKKSSLSTWNKKTKKRHHHLQHQHHKEKIEKK